MDTYKTKVDSGSDIFSNPISVTTKSNSKEIEVESNPSYLTSNTEVYNKNKKVEDKKEDPINGDSIIEIVANSISVDDMITSETPPDAISELEQVDLSNKEIENMEVTTVNVNPTTKPIEITPNKTTTFDKMKSHKRQQIPMEDNKVLPPETSESQLYEEIFAGFKDEASSTNTIEKVIDVESEYDDSKVSPSNSNIRQVGTYLDFQRNSETGELCTALNNTDESKTFNDNEPKYMNDTESFILNEKYLNNQDRTYMLPEDINVSDDIKVSRHSIGSLERPTSDDAKSIESVKYSSNVSNISVNNGHTENGTASLHSLELPVNESFEEASNSLQSDSELYTTALNKSFKTEREMSKISISTPDLINNVTITEAINTLNGDINQMMGFEENSKADKTRAMTINSISDLESADLSNQKSSSENNTGKHSSLTYITEIQVTPNSSNTNVSEVEILQPSNEATSRYSRSLEYARNYEIKNLDAAKTPKPTSENSKNIEIKNSFIQNENSSTKESQKRNESFLMSEIDAEKELHKIHEIAQEQLKKLPEMRFSTSSYESPVKNTEKRQSQVELLKSNFEKSPPKTPKNEIIRSRIPISTTMKTPPTTPEQKESSMTTDSDKEMFDSFSSPVHSTPMTNTFKYQKPSNSKNVSVTSIRTNSRIPSGLPVVSGIRPPVPPKRTDPDNDSLSSTNSRA